MHRLLLAAALCALAAGFLALHAEEAAEPESWPWPDELDAVAAAPESHVVLFENDRLRVLEVVIPPGEREPVHTHRWPSVMIVDGPARIRYYGKDGELRFETPADRPAPSGPPEPNSMGSEGPQAVENVDRVPFHAIRVEIKGE